MVVRQEVEMQNQVQAVRQGGMRCWSIARLIAMTDVNAMGLTRAGDVPAQPSKGHAGPLGLAATVSSARMKQQPWTARRKQPQAS